jgi:hypothetical protein
VKQVVESGGGECAVQRRRQPEGDQGEGEHAAQTLHGWKRKVGGSVVNSPGGDGVRLRKARGGEARREPPRGGVARKGVGCFTRVSRVDPDGPDQQR